MICCDCRRERDYDEACYRCRRPTCEACLTCSGGVMLCSECYEETVDAE